LADFLCSDVPASENKQKIPNKKVARALVVPVVIFVLSVVFLLAKKLRDFASYALGEGSLVFSKHSGKEEKGGIVREIPPLVLGFKSQRPH
jgi:hypothetical protein